MQNLQPFLSPLHSPRERKHRRTTGTGMDQSQRLGFDPEFPHPRKQLDHPRCGIDDKGAALRPERVNGGAEKIRSRARYLMTGDGLLGIGIHPSRSESPIGRIEDGRRKGLGRAERLRASDIPLKNLDFPRKAVDHDVPLRDVHERALDFDPQNTSAMDAPGQDQGNNPATRPQIDQLIPFAQNGKMGQQEGIHRETVTPLSLNDPQTASEDLIHRLIALQLQITIHDHTVKKWTKRPLRIFGSNQVDLGGMTFPWSATAIICAIVGG
jgi:hypothetical protein